jgi:hypothetical protein
MATASEKYINEVLRPVAEGVIGLIAADGAIRLDYAQLDASGAFDDRAAVLDDRSAEGLPPIAAAEVKAMHDLLTTLRDSLEPQHLALLNKFKVRSLPR